MIKRALVMACLMPTIASAASFDCEKAHSPLEKAVCTDSVLSALDSSIATSYTAAMERLSPGGQTILRDGQRQWLRFVRDLCLAHPDDRGVGGCLTQHYQERLNDLSNAAISNGPYLFSRSDYFSASTQDEDSQPNEIHAGAPRIDAPASPTIAVWNSTMAKQAMGIVDSSCDSQHGDEYSGFTVTYASARVISLRMTTWEYCHGTPHGHGGTTGLTYLMKPSFHSLEASDLFVVDTTWKDFLTRRSYDAIEKKADTTQVDFGQVEKVATDIRYWALTRDGLVITIDAETVLGYAFGTTEVIIPWRDLKPFLAPNAPIPPQT